LTFWISAFTSAISVSLLLVGDDMMAILLRVVVRKFEAC
jgi:hypothetical protein